MKLNTSRLTTALMIGTGIILLAAGLWTGLQPRYQATARIKIIGDKWRSESRWQGKEVPADILMGITEIYSSLGVVVETLPLAGELAGLKPPEAAAQLQRNVQVNSVPNTSLIEIKVASRDPNAAAQIANQIAAVNGNHTRKLVVDSATVPTHRVLPNLALGLKWMAPAALLLVAGLFIWVDQRRLHETLPA